MVDFVWWRGARVTPYMAYQLDRLNADLKRLFNVELRCSSGIRTAQEQIDVFLARYRNQATGNGPYGDVRWWQGRRYVRYSPDGTVAVPGTSNHEIQGNKAAVDISDTGRDQGVMYRHSPRGKWIRQNAGNYGMIASGDGFGSVDGFGEGWHFDILNIFAAVPGAPAGGGATPAPAPAPQVPKEDNDMTAQVRLNGKHIYTIGKEYISHNGTIAQAEIARKINSINDEQHELDSAGFNEYLDAMGVPRYVVNLGTGEVLNPQSKKYEGNGVWSREREAVSVIGEVRDILNAPKK